LLYLHSKRDWKREEIVKTILNFGRPIIIATDVSPPPKSVKKLARSFGCKIFYPEIPFPVLEKQELVKGFVRRAKNEHEIDALAASLKAWKKYRKFFTRVNYLLYKKGATDLFEEVVKRLIKEGGENVENVVEEVTKRRKLQSDKLVKKLEKIRMKKLEPLIELEKINDLELEKLEKLVGLKGRLIYCNSLENVNTLNKFNIKALLTQSNEEIDPNQLKFPILKVEKGFIKEVEGIKCVKKGDLEKIFRKAGLNG